MIVIPWSLIYGERCGEDRHKSTDQYEVIKTRNITEMAKNTIKEKLQSTDWNEVLNEPDCNRKWEKNNRYHSQNI